MVATEKLAESIAIAEVALEVSDRVRQPDLDANMHK
jgi:hypothetical protein